MVDENRFYLPDYPLEPLFRSVAKCTPDFNFGDIDFVSDRNGLRKLLDFVDNNKKDSFRIDFQKMGNMIAFIRNDEFASQNTEDYGKFIPLNKLAQCQKLLDISMNIFYTHRFGGVIGK